MSTRGRYGLRAMIELARRHGQGPSLLKEIAQAEDLSPEYLEQLMVPLRTAKLLRSVRGAKGGYLLARPPEQIRAKDIITALEGDLVPVHCVSTPERCKKARACAAQEVWSEIYHAMDGILSRITLADLCARQEALEGGGAADYQI
jgi:Rrf2 family protein